MFCFDDGRDDDIDRIQAITNLESGEFCGLELIS